MDNNTSNFISLCCGVATHVNKEKPIGKYEVEFNATNLTSGIYFYQMRAGKYIETKKMLIIK